MPPGLLSYLIFIEPYAVAIMRDVLWVKKLRFVEEQSRGPARLSGESAPVSTHPSSNTHGWGPPTEQFSATPATWSTVQFQHSSELTRTPGQRLCPTRRPPTFSHQSQVAGSPQLLPGVAMNRRSPRPLPWIRSFARTAPQAHGPSEGRDGLQGVGVPLT